MFVCELTTNRAKYHSVSSFLLYIELFYDDIVFYFFFILHIVDLTLGIVFTRMLDEHSKDPLTKIWEVDGGLFDIKEGKKNSLM